MNPLYSLSHRYIDECLKLFNFGPSIHKWVSLFFCNREAYILLGGELSKTILLEQGVPQGDVVSPYIFILAVELLLIKINNTKLIEGITYATRESRSETFADDTSSLNFKSILKLQLEFSTLNFES